MRWFRKLSRPSTPKPRPRVRPVLEHLEERAVPTVAFNPEFGSETFTGANDGMLSPTIHAVFQGAYWNTARGKAAESSLLSAEARVVNSPYLSGLEQYGSDGRAIVGSSWDDASGLAYNPPTKDLQAFLQSSIDNHSSSP